MCACSSQTRAKRATTPVPFEPNVVCLARLCFRTVPRLQSLPFTVLLTGARLAMPRKIPYFPVSTEPYGRPVQPVFDVSFCCVVSHTQGFSHLVVFRPTLNCLWHYWNTMLAQKAMHEPCFLPLCISVCQIRPHP